MMRQGSIGTKIRSVAASPKTIGEISFGCFGPAAARPSLSSASFIALKVRASAAERSEDIEAFEKVGRMASAQVFESVS